MVCLRRATVKCEAKALEEPMTVRTHVYIIYTKSRTGIGNLRDRVSIENAQGDQFYTIHRYGYSTMACAHH